MAKGQPFSVRLDEATEQLVEAEARRTRRSKSAVVERLTEDPHERAASQGSPFAATTPADGLG